MRFTKMQGLGNDYVYIDCTKEALNNLPELARKLSDRHFGVGSDGLICIFPSDAADFRMVMFNADGSEGAMCGNGIRCVGKFVYDKGLTRKTELTVETPAGVKHLALSRLDQRVTDVTVDMGRPTLGEPFELDLDSTRFRFVPVSMGNPHIVCVTAGVRDIALSDLGPRIEALPRFSGGVNIEFVEVLSREHLLIRVWERGSGETLACGTGACAALAACSSLGLADQAVVVTLPGGDLAIRWPEEKGPIYMTGPAVTVFEGEWPEE